MKSRRTILLLALLGLCVGSIVGCGGGGGESLAAPPARTNAETSATPLVPSRTTLDFGIVPQGTRQRLFVELRNASTQTIELDRIDASCDCLLVSVASSTLQPGERTLACLILDLAWAADFTGELEFPVKGLANGDIVLFVMKIDADVRPGWDFDALGVELPAESEVPPKPEPMAIPMDQVRR